MPVSARRDGRNRVRRARSWTAKESPDRRGVTGSHRSVAHWVATDDGEKLRAMDGAGGTEQPAGLPSPTGSLQAAPTSSSDSRETAIADG